jgi:hypothetical protein
MKVAPILIMLLNIFLIDKPRLLFKDCYILLNIKHVIHSGTKSQVQLIKKLQVYYFS